MSRTTKKIARTEIIEEICQRVGITRVRRGMRAPQYLTRDELIRIKTYLDVYHQRMQRMETTLNENILALAAALANAKKEEVTSGAEKE